MAEHSMARDVRRFESCPLHVSLTTEERHNGEEQGNALPYRPELAREDLCVAYGPSSQADVAVDPFPAPDRALDRHTVAARNGAGMTFEQWLASYIRDNPDWIPVEGVPDRKALRLARYAWTAGYRQHDSDIRKAPQKRCRSWRIKGFWVHRCMRPEHQDKGYKWHRSKKRQWPTREWKRA